MRGFSVYGQLKFDNFKDFCRSGHVFWWSFHQKLTSFVVILLGKIHAKFQKVWCTALHCPAPLVLHPEGLQAAEGRVMMGDGGVVGGLELYWKMWKMP